MRRIISGVLVYCLLHTSTYAAVTDLQSLNPATTSHTASHVNYGKLDPSIPDATTVSISADTSSKMLDIPHRPKAKRSPAFFMTMAGIAAVVFTGMWWKIQTPSVVQTDVCFHHQNRDHITHLQQKNDHRWNGNMPLTAGIQDWLNANTAVMTSLGEIAHDLRHGDHEHAGEKWSKTQSTLYNVLHNHGVEHLGARSIACDINLGDGTTPDRISACEHRKTPKHLQSETFKDGVGARLWLHPDRNQRLLAGNIHYVAGSFIDNQLYPNPVQSLNIESKEAKYDSRRKLLQTGNTLPLPQAIQTTINDREDVRVLLATIRGTLRQWDPSTAKISELNALTKSIFEAHGFVMTGDVHCGFVLDNGGVMLSDCAFASSGRADRSFAAQTALEKVTFLQSADNPVKVDGVEIETNVLPAQEALPLVLQRAANALHTELDQLRQDRCSVNDRSNVLAVQRVVKDALETPNAALSTDMACDVTIGNGGITGIRCAPEVAPESAVCGTYNGTFKTEGRVWVTPNGGFVVSANRNWNRTVEHPHTPSPERSESLTLKRTHTPNLSQTQTPQHTPSASLPAPKNTTTRLYWSNKDDNNAYMAEINQTSGEAINPRIFIYNIDNPMSMVLDPQNSKVYWASLSGSAVYVGDVSSITSKTQITNQRPLIREQVAKLFFDARINRFFYFPYQANYFYLHYFDLNPLNPFYNGTVNKLFVDNLQFYGIAGFAIDSTNNKIFIVCYNEICVGKIDYPNQRIAEIKKITKIFPQSSPFDIAYDFSYKFLYWRTGDKIIFRGKYNNDFSNISNSERTSLQAGDVGYLLRDYGGLYLLSENS